MSSHLYRGKECVFGKGESFLKDDSRLFDNFRRTTGFIVIKLWRNKTKEKVRWYFSKINV